MAYLREIINIFDGKEFEKIFRRLICLKLGETNFQEIPAINRGDFGIEGYSFKDNELVAYQCYAHEKNYETKKLYEKQRTKLTNDINKFENNSQQLLTLTGGKKFNRWFFVVTVFEAKELASHASKKTEEILRKNLKHIDDDFKIVIKTPDEFLYREIELYRKEIRAYINVVSPEIDNESIIDWQSNNSLLVANLTRKLSKIGLQGDDLNKSISQNIELYLILKKILDDVYQFDKEKYEDIINILNAKNKLVELKSSMKQIRTLNDIDLELSELNKMLQERLEDYLKPEIRDLLKTCKIADWLISCPLEFS